MILINELPAETAVLIGRFQPFHNGHLALLLRALTLAPRTLVLLGSAFQPVSPKHPLRWQERAELIGLALPAADRASVAFAPLRDHFDDFRWISSVRQAVAEAFPDRGPASRVALVGNFRDSTREYLRAFPDWTLHEMGDVPLRRASAMRQALFAAPDAALEELSKELPPTCIDWLRAWARRPGFAALAEEALLLERYETSWAAAPYPPVLVTVDCVVRCRDRVLLIRRGHAPGKGLFAVPGGFLEQRETTQQAALRELEEETHLDLPPTTLRASLRASDVFDRPDRSQRGRTITHGHFFDLGERELPALRADDDAAAAEWIPIAGLAALEEELLDDHFQMLDHYLGVLEPPIV